MTIGGFTAFTIYLSMLVGPLMGATFMMFVLQQGMTSLGSLLEVFAATPRHPAPRSSAGLSEPLAHGLAVRGLRFAYPDEPDRPVLDEVSFHVAPGEVIGVFGPVGSGKTTLVNLLNRYLLPPPGTVHLDGIDIRDVDPVEVRRHVVTVTQDPFLFSDTLRANVAFSMEEPASEGERAMTEEVEKALEAAALRSDLERMPEGLSTPVRRARRDPLGRPEATDRARARQSQAVRPAHSRRRAVGGRSRDRACPRRMDLRAHHGARAARRLPPRQHPRAGGPDHGAERRTPGG